MRGKRLFMAATILAARGMGRGSALMAMEKKTGSSTRDVEISFLDSPS